MSKWEPARVNGSKLQAVAFFIEDDDNGDLIDIEYNCEDCLAFNQLTSYAVWPGYEWPDYTVHCVSCGQVINEGTEE